VLWSFGGVTLTSGSSTTGGVLATVVGDNATSCFPATMVPTTTSFAPLPQGSGFFVSPMDIVFDGTNVWSYYQLFEFNSSQAFGIESEGFGVAEQDATSGLFVPTANLIWAAGGPSFGMSAYVQEGIVHVYGCGNVQQTGNSVCYHAQAPVSEINEPSAYSYSIGSGFFTSDPAEALPVLENAASVSVRPESSTRVLATYVGALGDRVEVSSALGPAEPFSQPFDLVICQLGSGDFCTGGVRHPELETGDGTVAVSYAAGSFSAEANGARYWPRLVFVPLPDALP